MTMAIEHRVSGNSDRAFFTAMALMSALAVFAGFAPSYFLRSDALPPLTWLYRAHGLLFTAWICLFIAQTALVAGHRTDIHRKLGVAGGAVAGLVS